MKFKRTVLLVAFVVVMGLLLGAITAQAATVICENEPEPCTEADSVIRIEDLEVTDSMGVTTVYTVVFRNDQAESVYGSTLVYDFTNQEDVSLAMEAVQEALNSNVPIPPGAGDQNSPRFFIGAKTVDDGQSAPYILALGSEYYYGSSEPSEVRLEGWDECTDSCLNGVTALEDKRPYVYAVFDDGSPKLLSPGGEIDDIRPDFIWRSVENATCYFLWVEDSEEEIIISDWYDAEEAFCSSSQGNFSEPGQSCNVPSPDHLILEDGSYNWWVLSWIPPTNSETNWEWSDPLSFTVAGPVPTTLTVEKLTVEKAGEGAGTVISNPPGIDCGETCSADFLGFAILKAIPDEGFELTDWAGCDEWNQITNDCTVLMTEAKTVNVIFNAPF